MLEVELVDVRDAGLRRQLRHPRLRLPRRRLHRARSSSPGSSTAPSPASPELPGIAVPACVHAGVIGVAPSHELMEAQRAREERIRAAGGPVADDAPEPPFPPSAAAGLRTIPPRETGGNLDIRRLVAGLDAAPARCTCRARCSRSATSTSRRATARSAARGSRSRPRSRCGSASARHRAGCRASPRT